MSPLVGIIGGEQIASSVGGTPYVGPADIASGCQGFWGMRAASFGDTGKTAIRIFYDGNPLWFNDVTTGPDGELNWAGAGVDPDTWTGHIVTVQFYNQRGSGGLPILGSADPNLCPRLTMVDGKPVVSYGDFDLGASQFSFITTLTDLATPFSDPSTFLIFAKNTPVSSTAAVVMAVQGGSGLMLIDYNNAIGNNFTVYPGGSVNVLADVTDNTWTSLASSFNGTSSKLYVNGVDSGSGTPDGSNTGGASLEIGRLYPDYPFTGEMLEIGYWPGLDLGEVLLGTISDNTHTFWGTTPVVVGYVGLGDIVSGMTAFWGPRAASSADIGKVACRLYRDLDVTDFLDVVTVEGGDLDPTAGGGDLAAWMSGHRIEAEFFNQIGTDGLPHLTNPDGTDPVNINQLPGLYLVGGKAKVTWPDITTLGPTGSPGGGVWMKTSSALPAQTIPFTITAYVNNDTTSGNGGIGQAGVIVANFTSAFQLSAASTPDGVYMYGGTFNTQTVAEGTWVSLDAVWANDATSTLHIDGTPYAADVGAVTAGSTEMSFGSAGAAGNYSFYGAIQEIAYFNGIAHDATEAAAISANQHGHWGAL